MAGLAVAGVVVAGVAGATRPAVLRLQHKGCMPEPAGGSPNRGGGSAYDQGRSISKLPAAVPLLQGCWAVRSSRRHGTGSAHVLRARGKRGSNMHAGSSHMGSCGSAGCTQLARPCVGPHLESI